MNFYAIIILSALIFDFSMNLIADILNLTALSGELPQEFSGIYDAETYRKSQVYSRVKIKFGIFTSSVDIALLLLFWFAGGFNFLDSVVRSWNLSAIWSGMAYIFILLSGLST